MKTKKPKCPKCDSSQNYFRQETKDHLCRICGHKWEKESAKKNTD